MSALNEHVLLLNRLKPTNRLESHVQVQVLVRPDFHGKVGADMRRVHDLERREINLLGARLEDRFKPGADATAQCERRARIGRRACLLSCGATSSALTSILC